VFVAVWDETALKVMVVYLQKNPYEQLQILKFNAQQFEISAKQSVIIKKLSQPKYVLCYGSKVAIVQVNSHSTNKPSAVIFKSIAKGFWGILSSGQQTEEEDTRTIEMTVKDNLLAVFSEKDRVFTNLIVAGEDLIIVCDRSGRIYLFDSHLIVKDLPLKGYRDVQITCLGESRLLAFLPKRNLLQLLDLESKADEFLELDKM
jgi:hypothetical protein